MRLLILKITLLVVACFVAVTLYFDSRLSEQATELTARRTLEDSTHLLLTMREVYRERIQLAKLPISKDSIRLCPGSVIGEMAERYDPQARRGISFGNYSDRPRNERNRADPVAQKAIDYFQANPDASSYFTALNLPNSQRTYQIALPLWTEASCLSCHGAREETLPLVQQTYEDGFNHQLGDLRGVLLARIGADKARSEELWVSRLQAAVVTAMLLFLLLWLAFDRSLLKRLRLLSDAVAEIGQGGYRKLAVGPEKDEVNAVLHRFNGMVDAIHEREEVLNQYSKTIAHQKQYLDSVLDSLRDPVIVVDTRYRIVTSNEAARRRYGRHLDPNGEAHCYKVLHDSPEPCSEAQRRCPLREVLASGESSYLTHTSVNLCGKPVLYDVAAKPLLDAEGKISSIVESFHDVTDLVQNEAELRLSREQLDRQAHSDPLTGLPNRRSFEEELASAVNSVQEGAHSLGLAFLDLDGFKDINDTLGHPVGDELLRIVAQRLRHSVRASDFVARLAGDEFVVVVHDLQCREVMQGIAGQVLETFRRPVILAGENVHVTASIGVAFCPSDARSADDLIKAADIAMYSAKAAGRNCVRYFAPDMDEAVRSRFTLTHDLQAALERGEFFLVYQPQFSADGQHLRGVEALMRWQSPSRGLVMPEQFVPILEESGLIREATDWLFDESMRQLRSWLDQGMPEVILSLNVSAADIEQPGFVERVLAHLQRHAIPNHLLELEMTERLALNNLELVIKLLHRLRSLGIRSAMDDFGTGYSSLASLTQLPIDTLKIDRSFVRKLSDSDQSRGVVQLIAGLGQLMNMEIVAEGVEAAHELDGVREAGCHYVQGFLFSQPLPPAEIPACVEKAGTAA